MERSRPGSPESRNLKPQVMSHAYNGLKELCLWRGSSEVNHGAFSRERDLEPRLFKLPVNPNDIRKHFFSDFPDVQLDPDLCFVEYATPSTVDLDEACYGQVSLNLAGRYSADITFDQQISIYCTEEGNDSECSAMMSSEYRQGRQHIDEGVFELEDSKGEKRIFGLITKDAGLTGENLIKFIRIIGAVRRS